MKWKVVLFMAVLAASAIAWADSKEHLTQARSQYRQAVAQHGAGSFEARRARQNLRATRRSFHAERRQRNGIR